ncbi:MAG TPA: protein-(glutamine-N5) methyltransferase, release factor-specific, partial [Gammaproteobacteria bacterium]|nr:protein-(glutamine-N5) methyltransferase, release factor-specific [Gammaproteobacteria bacterium]
MTTVAGALGAAAARLAERHDSARLDAEILLTHALGRGRSHLYAWPEAELTSAQAAAFEALVERRMAGEPVAYLVGRREFWS